MTEDNVPVWYPPPVDETTTKPQSPLEKLILSMFEKLNWELDDDIEITISGSQTSGIDQPEGYNKKWATPLGEVKYNHDAFIVIQNRDRSPYTPSVPPPVDSEQTGENA